MTSFKVGLVGCGRIAQKHLAAIVQQPDHVEIVACCDVDKEKMDNFHPGINCYTDLSTMLASEDLDIVSLCTPSGLHAEQAILCAKHDVNVISEKPMATTWQDGLDMHQAFEASTKQLFIVKQNRLNPTIQLLKQAIERGWFGRLFTLQANVFWTRPQAYYDQAAWRGTYALDGGALMNQASHYVDLLEWLGGPITAVQAMGATLARNIEAEDTISLNLQWQHGAVGSMCVSMLTYPQNLEGSITILGEHGTVKLGGVALNKFETWSFASADAPSLVDVNQSNYSTDSVYGSGHAPYYQNVAEVLRGRAKPVADGSEGLKSLEVILAAYQSCSNGKTVSLGND